MRAESGGTRHSFAVSELTVFLLPSLEALRECKLRRRVKKPFVCRLVFLFYCLFEVKIPTSTRKILKGRDANDQLH